MRFRDFIMREMGTFSNCIANFARPAIPTSRRTWPSSIAAQFGNDPPEDPNSKKTRKPYKQPQVEESTRTLST